MGTDYSALNYSRAKGAPFPRPALINTAMGTARRTMGIWLEDALGLLLPRRCAGCDDALYRHEEVLCDACRAELPLTLFNDDPLNPVERLFHGKVALEAAGALLRFNAHGLAQRLLHRIKYRDDREAAGAIGAMMGEALAASERFRGIDAVIAVPLHPAKERRRGYNQSHLLADGIRTVLPLEPLHHALRRAERTATQTRKGRLDRWQNVKEAFEAPDPGLLHGRHVLLVDDVVTTGATAEACALAVQRAPGARVSFFAAACA